jgi:hypothetical protein
MATGGRAEHMVERPKIREAWVERSGRVRDMRPGDDDAPELTAVERLKAEVARLLEVAGRLVAAHPGASAMVGRSVEQLERLDSRLDDRLEALRSGHPEGPLPE